MSDIVNTKPTIQVPPEGSLDSKIVIVGDFPGAQEIKLQRPFVGGAGLLLNNVLRTAGVNRADCYITYVIKEQPYKNNASSFINLYKSGYPTTPKYDTYVDQLKDELSASNANIIIALGNISLYALTDLTGPTKRRGSIYKSTLIRGKKVISVIDPKSAEKNYIYQHFIVYDLKRALKESSFPELKRPERNIMVAPLFNQVKSFLGKCREKDMVAFDIEVSNEEVSCISFAYDEDNVMSIPFIQSNKDYFSIEQELDIWLDIGDLLEDSKIIKIGQNVIFDATFIFRRFGIVSRPLHDTMIGQAILFPDFPKGLDFITSIYTSEPYYKDEGKRRIKGGGGSDRAFWIYNAKDSLVLMEAFPKIYNDLSNQGNKDIYQQTATLLEPLMYMSERGIKMDTEGMKKASDEADDKIQKLTEELWELTGDQINPNSPKQLADYFYVTKKAKAYRNRKTGGVTTGEDALKRLSKKGFKEAKILLSIRKWTKLKSTYFDVSLDEDGRLRGAMNPVGASSGRLSSSKTIFGTGANMQNQPPQMKEYMIADEGYILYSMDLSQAENRVVAYVSPEAAMISAFKDGRDIHSQTAALIFGKPVEDISNEPGSCTIGGGSYSERFWGKKANHGLNYDLGYKSFAFLYEIPEAESKFIVERYHQAYPGVRHYHSWVRAQLQENRTLENCYGRKRTFVDRWGNTLFKEAYSFIPQSSVADKINRDAVIPVYYEDGYDDVELLNQVHDSIVFQIPIEVGLKKHAEYIIKIRDNLQKPMMFRGQSFVVPTDMEMGFNLKRTIEVKVKDVSSVDELHNLIKDAYEEINE
jgi:DNA polymerase-1